MPLLLGGGTTQDISNKAVTCAICALAKAIAYLGCPDSTRIARLFMANHTKCNQVGIERGQPLQNPRIERSCNRHEQDASFKHADWTTKF